jgi:hypothetical protein
MNQSERVCEFRGNGWSLSHKSNCGFIHLYKRDTDPEHNYIIPNYFETTIFKNGRYAQGDYKKYPRRQN